MCVRERVNVASVWVWQCDRPQVQFNFCAAQLPCHFAYLKFIYPSKSLPTDPLTYHQSHRASLVASLSISNSRLTVALLSLELNSVCQFLAQLRGNMSRQTFSGFLLRWKQEKKNKTTTKGKGKAAKKGGDKTKKETFFNKSKSRHSSSHLIVTVAEQIKYHINST